MLKPVAKMQDAIFEELVNLPVSLQNAFLLSTDILAITLAQHHG